MTMLSLTAVGLCAHYSPVGDRAMRYALGLARKYDIQLNIFTFLRSPFRRPGETEPEMSPEERQQKLIRADRRIREYYEDRLGDYLQVGFRVCEGRENIELRRCLKRKEYDLLVIPYLETGGNFAGVPIEEFAYHFMSPVVLVGRWRKVRYYLNPQAALLADKLLLFKGTWRPIRPVSSSCPA